MQFGLDEDQKMIVDTVRRFAEATVGPGARDLDEAEAFGASAVSGLAELGLMGMFADPEVGGGGLDALGGALVIEEIARHDASLAVVVAQHNGQAVLHMEQAAPAALKQAWLPKLVSGEALCGWAGDVQGLTVEDGALTGTARNLVLAEIAAGFVLSATDGTQTAAFFVEKGAAGLRVEPMKNRLGLRGAGLGHLHLEHTPAVRLEGPAAPADVVERGHLLFGAACIGVARGALEEARAYALDRKQFNKPIAQFHAIQWKLADVATETDAARLLVHRAAALAGATGGGEAVRQARFFAADTAVKAAYEAIQIFGGNGFVREFPVERFLRDAKVLQGGFGAADALRQAVSAARLESARIVPAS